MSGPQQISYPPLIPASVNMSSNTSNCLKSQSIISDVLEIPYNISGSSGTVILSGGTLTGLITSSNLNDTATKAYSDSVPYPEPGGPIDNSIQTNNGSGLFIGYDSLKWSTTLPGTLNLVGSLNIYPSTASIVINNNRVQNVAEPILPQSAANKEYVQGTTLTVTNIMTSGSAVTTYLTPSNVINVILQRTFNTTGILDQDILPNAVDIINAIPGSVVGTAFTFIYKYINIAQGSNYRVIVLYGNSSGLSITNIIPKGDYFYINTEDNNINIYPETIVEFTGTIISTTPGSEIVNFYINNYQQLYVNNLQQQTPYGLLTNNLFTQKNAIFNNAFVIKPMIPTLIADNSGTVITLSDIKNILIIRSGTGTGLTGDITDNLDSVSNMFSSTGSAFAQGSGLIRFTIQNVDPIYNITIGSTGDSGWTFSYGSRTIKSGYNGLFGASFNVESTSAILFTFGLASRNG